MTTRDQFAAWFAGEATAPDRQQEEITDYPEIKDCGEVVTPGETRTVKEQFADWLYDVSAQQPFRW